MLPVDPAYVPGEQLVQSTTESCKSGDLPASLLYDPGSQATHAEEVEILILPAAHTVHVYEKADPETVPEVARAAPFVADDEE